MTWTDALSQSGDHSLTLKTKAADLEAVLSVPEEVRSQSLVFLGHPNSLQGGSMQNKVVTTLARACKEQGLASLRMNFRGVGASSGDYDNGIGESEDMLEIVDQWRAHIGDALAVFAGFSFGSYVTYRAAAQRPHRLLLSIAPAIDRHDYTAFAQVPHPWEIVMGQQDEVVPFESVQSFAKIHAIPFHPFEETGHFFHGRLIELRSTINQILAQYL